MKQYKIKRKICDWQSKKSFKKTQKLKKIQKKIDKK